MKDEENKWLHNQELSFKQMREKLLVIKNIVESTLIQKKAELKNNVEARDCIKPKMNK